MVAESEEVEEKIYKMKKEAPSLQFTFDRLEQMIGLSISLISAPQAQHHPWGEKGAGRGGGGGVGRGRN